MVVRQAYFLLLLVIGSLCVSSPSLIFSEVHGWAARSLEFPDGITPHFGVGPSWNSPNWTGDSVWNVSTPSFSETGVYSVYLRCPFQVSAADASSTNTLQLNANWADGFIAFINGVEIQRANMGNSPMYGWYDAQAFNLRPTSMGSETFSVGTASSYLKAGQNLLAIQVHGLTVPPLTYPPLPVSSVVVDGTFTLDIASGSSLVTLSNSCKLFRGIDEPSGIPYDSVPYPGDGFYYQGNWVELTNVGSTPLSLAGWSFTDAFFLKTKFVFPSTVSLGVNQSIVVMVDKLNYTGDYFHTSFELNAGNTGYIFDSNGNFVIQFDVPNQSRHYSYGIDPISGDYVYFSVSTPGVYPNDAANPRYTQILDPPTISVPSGQYSSAIVVNVTSKVPGAVIKYSLDSTDPLETSNTYLQPFIFSSYAVLRVIAVLPGAITSMISTETYLFNQPPAFTSSPSLIISGHSTRSIYDPEGILTIQGGTFPYPSGSWQQTSSTSYSDFDMCLFRGDFTRRVVNFALVFPDGYGVSNISATDVSLRVSYSGYQRPQAVVTRDPNANMNGTGLWNTGDANYKPSLNLGYSSDYGSSKLYQRVIPAADLLKHDNFRLRAGKNDISNPYIIDEWTRRVYKDTGNPSAVGFIAGLYVNGILKGVYNIVEKIDQMWLSGTYQVEDSAEWDVLKENVAWEDGDGVFANEMIDFMMTNDLVNNLTAYQMVDDVYLCVDCFIDYILTNSYFAMWDWPTNNLYAGRQRAAGPTGRYRFWMWDAEGAIGLYDINTLNYNTFTSQLITTVSSFNALDLPIQIFSLIYTAPEFQLRWQDRVQKHLMSTDGALALANLQLRWDEVLNEYTPICQYLFNSAVDQSRFQGWIAGGQRLAQYLPQLESLKFWQTSNPPPVFTAAETYTSSSSISVSISASVGTVYYVLDGTDPRLLGGNNVGTVYSNALTITTPTRLCARALSGSTWSPIQCTSYGILPAYYLTITEIMFTHIQGKKYQFIEIKNTGSNPIDCTGVVIQASNVTYYKFPEGYLLEANSFYVVSSNFEVYQYFYQKSPDGVLLGYLDQNTASISLIHTLSNYSIHTAVYDSKKPWPKMTDGMGFSLVPLVTNPTVNDPVYLTYSGWRQSANFGGSPGSDDPTPPTYVPIKVNELSPNPSNGNDWVELYNPSSTDFDISYWWLTDTWGNPRNHIFASGTIIKAGSYLVLNAKTDIPFAFSSSGESVWLIGANFSQTPTGYYHGFSYDYAPPDVIYARYNDTNGYDYFAVATTNTSNATNAPPVLPTLGTFIISAITYAPSPSTQSVTITSLWSTDVNILNYTLAVQGNVIYTFPSIPVPAFSKYTLTAPELPLDSLPTNGGDLLLYDQNGNLLDEIRYQIIADWPIDPPGFLLSRRDSGLVGADADAWVGGPAPVYTVNGIVFNDKNQNGVYDSGDSLLPNVSVCLNGIQIADNAQLTCLTANSTGDFSVDSNEMPLLSPSHGYLLGVSLTDSVLLKTIPYPAPISPTTVLPTDTSYITTQTGPPLKLYNYLSIAIANIPATITGVISFNGKPLNGVTVSLFQKGVRLSTCTTTATGIWMFSEASSSFVLNTDLNVEFSLVIQNVKYVLPSGSGWTQIASNASLILVPTQFARGTNNWFNSSLIITPTPTPTLTPSNSPSSIPSVPSTSTPSRTPSSTPSNSPSSTPSVPSTSTPSRTPSSTPSNSPSSSPSTTPSSNTPSNPSGAPSSIPNQNPTNNTDALSGGDGNGILGIGVAASIGVIAAIAVVFVIIVAGIIVGIVKCSSTALEVV